MSFLILASDDSCFRLPHSNDMQYVLPPPGMNQWRLRIAIVLTVMIIIWIFGQLYNVLLGWQYRFSRSISFTSFPFSSSICLVLDHYFIWPNSLGTILILGTLKCTTSSFMREELCMMLFYHGHMLWSVCSSFAEQYSWLDNLLFLHWEELFCVFIPFCGVLQ